MVGALFVSLHFLFFRFDRLPCDLQQLMRGAQSPFAHFAEHLRKFKQARLAIEPFDACQGAAIVLTSFCT